MCETCSAEPFLSYENEIHRILNTRVNATRKKLILYSDTNLRAQIVAAASLALHELPNIPCPSWSETYVDSATAAHIIVAAEDGGYDYDWMVENLDTISFTKVNVGWDAVGEITARFGQATAVLNLSAPAPRDTIKLMQEMGFIHYNDPYARSGSYSFACGI